MRIINLIENLEGNNSCIAEHGLSFYIETENHKILMDLGPSESSLSNAKKLGVELKDVDIVVLSHGHYDHSGGIIPFSKINNKAKIYIHKKAFGEYYVDDKKGGDYRYIGIDSRIKDLDNIILIEDDLKIDNEISIITNISGRRNWPKTNNVLLKKENDKFVQDKFDHEQFLVLSDKDRDVLFSGCAHNGILNIIDTYKKRYNKDPYMLISGFHMITKTEYSEEDILNIKETARELCKYNTKFYTGHCTGIEAFEIMKEIMKDKLNYAYCGEEIKWK